MPFYLHISLVSLHPFCFSPPRPKLESRCQLVSWRVHRIFPGLRIGVIDLSLGFHRRPRMEKGGECAFSTYYKLKAVADSSSIYNPVFEIIRHWMYFYEFREGIVFVRKRDIDIASYGLSIDSFLWIMNQSIFIVKECPIFSNEKHEHYHQKCQENGIFCYFENIIEKHIQYDGFNHDHGI